MANHLIIGLGGTGGKVLREIRKRVYEEFNSNDPSNGVNLDYIYVDSSDDELNSRADWKVMGKSVHLHEAQKVSIHGINASMFQNLNMYPGIQCFLNKEDIQLMTSKLGSLITAGLGGQRRRLGRTLLANNLSVSDSNADFVSRLKQSVQRICSNSGDQSVTFHICAGLAGGTGSGSIIDIISQIRKEFPPQPGSNPYKIYLYLYVPEMAVVTPSHDSGFYQANGYAALLELNALSVGKYFPYDITGQKDIYSGEIQRLLQNVNAFEGAYLYSNVNEAGKMLDLANGLPANVADFIFQKTVAIGNDKDAKMGRLEGCENDGAGPENDRANTPSRSRKFLAFGIKRIEYPETEIEQLVTYNFARQAARQLEFNFWQEGIGYGECSIDEVGTGYRTEIRDRKNRERLMLSNNYLMLSKPIVEGNQTRRWKDIDSTWEERLQLFADDTQTQSDKKSWLAIFTDACTDYYEKNFRSLGVKKFYSTQLQEADGYAQVIRRHIENTLFDEWNSGQKSLLEIEKYVQLLIMDCRDRIEEFKKNIASMEDELATINGNIHLINTEWNNIGWLQDAITKKSQKVFSEYKTQKTEYYTTATRIEAYNYAVVLLQKVIQRLGDMCEGIVKYKGILSSILEDVGKQADSKCRKTAADETDNTLKKYDVDQVQRFTKQCVVNPDIQNANALAIRNRLVSSLGEDGEHSFANMCDKTDYDTATSIILDICQRNANAAMDDAVKNDPLNKMVGVNILEKLKQEFNTDEKLEQFVRQCVQQAQVNLQFNSEEQGKVFDNAGGRMMKMIQLSIPKYEEDNSGFRDKLIRAFEHAYPGFNPKEDVSVSHKKNQIVVVAAASGFPLRYVTNVKVIKEKYDALLASPDAILNKMVLHTESFNEPLPSLFEASTQDLLNSLRKPVILAYAFGLIQQKENITTGAHFDAINIPDPDGLGDGEWRELGKTLIESTNSLAQDYSLAKKLIELVNINLSVNARSNDQKEGIKAKIRVILKEKILASPECENNEFNETYKKYIGFCREIFNKELKTL